MSSASNGYFGLLEDYSMWRDFENNKVYVKCGTEIIEVPRAIAEAYRQYEAENFRLYHAMFDRSKLLETENAKLRKLCEDIFKCFRGVVFEGWAYSSEEFRMYEQRIRELGIEV